MSKPLADEISVELELIYSDLSLVEMVGNQLFQHESLDKNNKDVFPVFARIHKEGEPSFFGQFVYLINMLDVAIEVTLRNVMTRYNNEIGWEKTDSYTIPANQKLHLGMTSSGNVANGAGFEYTVQASKVLE
ncbi:hypothetical protein HWQ46_19270 [Shewanella sp. D64]|uniref:hypothetical protein n=1 Tax=unclassified Shewanella TaxID=196818 RepID=UPI0022BA68B8|nr:MULTISPECIES: hypothetical protein [unclassified Shewanella]MEC4727690.1 hypothetical protein [Shewanella sp. D64]MEC4739737.1 hypothetical protein [Shewanella sp. E94]WBJ94086.1 hypothetical protein HWQ47_19585 [Shewanella sp. MTB7]